MNDQKDMLQDDVTEEMMEAHEEMQEDTQEDVSEHTEQRKSKTYIAIIIALAGVACGSLFVDVAQLFGQKGFSARAIKDAQVVEYDGATWVRFDDPKVVVDVFVADDCEACVTDEVLTQLRTALPTMEAHKIDVNSEEGKSYAKMHNIAYIPAFVFAPAVTETDFYQQTAILFKESKDKYVLDTASVGIPVGKYIAQPETKNGMLYGNAEAPVQVVMYQDLTSPDSTAVNAMIEKVRAEYGDRMHLAVKLLADPEQAVAKRTALAATCAYMQDKYSVFLKAYTAQKQKMTNEATIDDALKNVIKSVQMNEEQYSTCMNDTQNSDGLTQSVEEARRFGIQALPTVFVNGEILQGQLTYESFKGKIDAIMIPQEEMQGE